MHQKIEGALTPAALQVLAFIRTCFQAMEHGLQTHRVVFRLGERAPAPLVRICFLDGRLSSSTCQVGYVQYIRAFTHGPLSSRPWLPLAHQTVRESQSDTNYAEGVGIYWQTRHFAGSLLPRRISSVA